MTKLTRDMIKTADAQPEAWMPSGDKMTAMLEHEMCELHFIAGDQRALLKWLPDSDRAGEIQTIFLTKQALRMSRKWNSDECHKLAA